MDLEGHGALRLTDACRPVLRGEAALRLRRESRPARAKKSKSARAASSVFTDPADVALWDALRRLRRELAEREGVPPYVVFHDATLAEMVARRPRTLDQFAAISGVGERKLSTYGAVFLDVVAQSDPSIADAHEVAQSTEANF